MEKKEFVFDKFMNDIVKREEEAKQPANQKSDDDPRRKYNNLYRERWQNRIVWAKRYE
tara:strand:- start:271 stop:444 length:174 start_codon:yes stop_codon:yes gene_type:complete